ncbi:MAG TPA: IPT/TIG domain-containing protein, partial [Thermoanaerobaculia bacterium]
TIGGQPATLVRVVSPNEIVVRAPNLAVGFHDVVVRMGDETYRRNAAYHFFDYTAPAHEAFFEPVLLPVLFKGPGAFGSQWDVEATIRNANEYPLSTPHASWFDVLCMPVCEQRTPANTTRRSQKSNAPYGAIELIPRQAAPLVSYGLLIRDLSRQSEALGTEVPVVREHELYSRAYSLVNVPTDSRFRTSLRVYALQPAMTTSVGVRISTMDGTLLVDEQLLVPKERDDRTEPAYVLVPDILARWPQLAGKGSVTIELVPGGGHGAPKSWAFASVTNNTTQHVTVISPQ